MLKCLNVKMNKGVSLYLTVIIMSILLAIVLGLSAILVGQMKTLKGIENSVVAFYAADTGIEDALYPDRANPTTCDCPGTGDCTKTVPCILDNGAEYYVEVEVGGSGDCGAPHFCIKSIGTYQKTKRAIEISY